MPKSTKKAKKKNKTRSEAGWKARDIGRLNLRLPNPVLKTLGHLARERSVTRAKLVEQMIAGLAQEEAKRKHRSKRAAEARDRRDQAFDDRIKANARHRDVVHACKVFGIEPPKQGDQLERGRARAAYGRYMAKNHPDRGGTRQMVQEGLDAWKILTEAFGWS